MHHPVFSKLPFLFLFVSLTTGGVDAQIPVGAAAPTLTLERIYHSGSTDTASYNRWEGRITVLDFWATWCGPCIQSFPHFTELYRQFAGADLRFVAISYDPQAKLENFLGNAALEFPVGWDPDRTDFASYDIAGIPQQYVINRKGVVVYNGRTLSASMLQEVLETDTLDLSTASEAPLAVDNSVPLREEVNAYGNMTAGSDPMYAAMQDLVDPPAVGEDRPLTMPVTAFTIRPSLPANFQATAERSAEGWINLTLIAHNLSETLAFLYRKSSPGWVVNTTQDTSVYDLIYRWPGEEREEVYLDIADKLLAALNFQILEVDTLLSVQSIERSGTHEDVVSRAEIPDGSQRLFYPLTYYVQWLSRRNPALHLLDPALEDAYVKNLDGPNLNKLGATWESVTAWLATKGIVTFRKEKTVKLLHITRAGAPLAD